MSPRSYASIADEDVAEPSPTDTDDLTEPGPGRRLGRYELVRLLGSGGMANVYLARAVGPGGFEKLFALKCIHGFLARDRRFVQMFLDEARISALVSHPNVAQVFELGEDRGIHFLAMELLHGEHLGAVHARALRDAGVMPPDVVASIVGSAAEGLHQAHETEDPDGKPLGIVHRDVSPQNVFVTYDGLVKVTDFGIAKAANRLVETDTGSVKGKFGYMAPEQALGLVVDRRTDVFALGVVLWELLTGRRLFRAKTNAETLLNVTRCEVVAPSSIHPACPRGLESIALRALAREATDRYPTSAALAEDLAGWLRAEHHRVDRARLVRLMAELFPERAANRPRVGGSSQDVALPPSGAQPVVAAEPSHSGVRPGSGVASVGTAEAKTEILQGRTGAVASQLPVERPSDDGAGPVDGSSQGVWSAAVDAHDEPSIVLPVKRWSTPWIVGGATLLVGVGIAAALVVTRAPPAATHDTGAPPRPAPAARATPGRSPDSRPSALPTSGAAPASAAAPALRDTRTDPAPPTPAFSAGGRGPLVENPPTVSPSGEGVGVTGERPSAQGSAPVERPERPRTRASSSADRADPPAIESTERWGYLNLITTPWARVWIDGQPAGNTPLYRRRVAAGTRTLELRAEGRGPARTLRLHVGAGETVSRRVDLAAP
ncbi:MAG: serine/threonine protein kinase [Deltaproteobacteria bacterium]|nr:serine/threonine protein kinase [Deltaproteobacteria bacterium]